MSTYGYDESWIFHQLDEKYRNFSPHSPYGGCSDPEYERYKQLKAKFTPPLPSRAERQMDELTAEAKTAEKEGRYLDAEELWLKIAEICHKIGLEHSAYLAEHRAMQCRHQQVYKYARISIQPFSGVPNLDKLQDALTDAAKKCRARKDYASLTVYSLLNARLCHAQGKERDAFLLEESVRNYDFFDQYFVRPGEPSNNPPVEEVLLQQIAADYADELYPK